MNVHLVAALEHSRVSAASGSQAPTTRLLRASALGGPWGRVGGSPTVDAEARHDALAQRRHAGVEPVALDEFGRLVNCNADAAAGALAGALDAEPCAPE